LNQNSRFPACFAMSFERGQELGSERVVQSHELARILPGMSARRTVRPVWGIPHRSNWRPSPTPPINSPPPTPPRLPPRRASTTPSTLSSFSNSVHLPPELSPPWPWNPSETQLIHAGYQPAYKPPTPPKPTTSPPKPEASSSKKRAPKPKKPVMAEPRARAARHKGQMNFSSER
jgi:transcription initiation factor TFIID subunit 13